MRRPKYSDCEDEHGHVDWECYTTAMGDYEDEQRDLQIEQRWEEEERIQKKKEEQEHYADYSDQPKVKGEEDV